MSPENALAWELMQLSIGETTRHLAEPLLLDEVASAEERVLIRRRVAGALHDPEVTAILYPKATQTEADGGTP